jgi:hypothetical protein
VPITRLVAQVPLRNRPPRYVGLLLNFGPKAEFKCRIYDNDRKVSLTWVRKLTGANMDT